jgi:ketosteroid isomerase-like protein
MPRANVDLVRALFDAWNSSDLESVAPLISEEIEWLEVDGVPDAPGVARRGREAMFAGLDALFETWQQYRLEPQEVRDVAAGRVVAVVREVARGRASGVEVASEWGYVMTIRDGKLARVEAYRNPAAALEAVGLS